jgi:hypothetical protein
MGNWKALGYDKPTKTIYSAEGMPIEVDRIDEALRQKSAKDAAPFLLPQLKSMELTGDAGAAAAMALTQMLASAVAKKESKNAGNGGTEPGTDS